MKKLREEKDTTFVVSFSQLVEKVRLELGFF